MNNHGPIVIIEDDKEDQEMLSKVFEELKYPYKLIFFKDSELALEFLTCTLIKPFLVLSDIHMPKLNGMELRDKINNNEDIKFKTIPYLFFSTTADQRDVINAYSKTVQGFFIKPTDYNKLKNLMIKIVEYWQECESPGHIENPQ